MEKEQSAVIELVKDVCKFYKQDVTAFTLQVWANAMQPFDFEQVSKAFSAHVVNPDNGQFMPKPADLIKQLQGTTSDKAAIAWGKAFDAASSVGAYQDVVFDDPAIHAAINDLGGWPKFARCETKDLSYMQHRFTQSYQAYANKGEYDYPKRLAGDRSPDSDYLMIGRAVPKPALIGNPDKAKAVMRGGTAGGKTMISLPDLAMKAIAA